MTTPDEVLAYLKILAWPTIVLLAIILFRDPLRKILGGIEGLEGFGVKISIRQQVTQAAQDAKRALASDGSPALEPPGPTPHIGILYVIVLNMQNALQFSADITRRPDPASTSPLERMRAAVDQLNSSVVAVLIATAFTGPSQAAELTAIPRPDSSNPAEISTYLFQLTGFRGWRGIMETRDILRGTLVLICRRNSQTINSDEATPFIDAAVEAIRQLNDLVNVIANWVQPRAL